MLITAHLRNDKIVAMDEDRIQVLSPLEASKPRRICCKGAYAGLRDIAEYELALMRRHRIRSGIGSSRLLHGVRNKPEGLRGPIVDSWLCGKTRRARSEHISFILELWAAMPDGARIPLTPEMAAQLEHELLRTGHGPYTVLKWAEDVPPGLREFHVFAWLDEAHQSVNSVHWSYVISRLASMPDKPIEARPSTEDQTGRPSRSPYSVCRPRHLPISDEQWQTLNRHRQRTCVRPPALLKGAADKPAGLNAPMISAWLSGKTRTAEPHMLAYVIKRYAALPDA